MLVIDISKIAKKENTSNKNISLSNQTEGKFYDLEFAGGQCRPDSLFISFLQSKRNIKNNVGRETYSQPLELHKFSASKTTRKKRKSTKSF